ncbi:hypothetical protein [Sphingomonas sp.]|uniref:hypothetical protein n=1 Tax=Sphingomonas sp. TaxID=28214 RepID=UPI002C8665F6|nr:hypothetical protein [Sphingomonas sp.]HTG38581.1 hypothetical protein [Sphingomonas sp.]
MSLDLSEQRGGESIDASNLLASASRAQSLCRLRREASVRDLLTPDDARLDDQRRYALRTLLRAIVGTIGGDIQDHAHRTLTQRGATAAAQALTRIEAYHIMPAVERCLGQDTVVAGELIERVTLDLIGSALPSGIVAAQGAPWPAGHRTLDQRLLALRQAEGRRQAPPDQPPYAIDLTAECQARFVWWIAAAIARAADADGNARVALDRAIADAGGQVLAGHDEGEGLEGIAARLALSLDLRGDLLVPIVEHCLGERRIVLLVAILAHALGVEGATMRTMIVDPADPRLWLVLRALDLPRETVARLGYAVCEADRRRDVEMFADRLDAIMAISPDAADGVLANLRLPADFRAALDLQS